MILHFTQYRVTPSGIYRSKVDGKRRSIHTQSLNEIEAFPIKSNVPPSENERIGWVDSVRDHRQALGEAACFASLADTRERALRNAS
jgi:hypothetical protein